MYRTLVGVTIRRITYAGWPRFPLLPSASQRSTGGKRGTPLSIVLLSGYVVGQWGNTSEDILEFVSSIRPRRGVVAVAAALDVSWRRS